AENKPRSPVPVQVTVLRGRYLKGTKSDAPVTYVRAEFNGTLLGDSPKLEASPETGVEYNFTSSFDCNFEGQNNLDDIAHKPFILTIVEILPKERKQKEEKTAVLAQATVDLLPLLQGECTFKTTVTLHAVATASVETTRQDAPKPILEVAVFVPEPLLTEYQIEGSNLLKVTVEVAYSVPEAWNITGPQFNTVVSLQVPASSEKECILTFPNGILKPGGEKEPTPRQKKWPTSNILAPGAHCIPESFIHSSSYDEEDGDLNRESKEFRLEAETEKKRVVWDFERRCFLEPDAVITLRKRIAECRYWPVEITRSLIPTFVKGKAIRAEKGDDDSQLSSHGVAYVNMAPLLYPGVKQIRGAYQIVAYNETEIFEKTKQLNSVVREVACQFSVVGKPQAPAASGLPHPKVVPSKTLREEKGVKEPMQQNSALLKLPISESLTEMETHASQNVEGLQYVEAKSYILLEFALEKPLVPKRPPEELAKRVQDLIPPRPAVPRRYGGAQKAVKGYHSQISSIASTILDEYHYMFGQQIVEGRPLNSQTLEEQKRKLNYELNFSGKYFAFKEQLKHSVVKIVREKYLKTTAFEDREELQAFLSELYIYLVDQMHIALNKTLVADTPEPVPDILADYTQLKHFAREAEINEEFDLAAKYYQEILARDRNNPDHWFDYGTFCLLISDDGKAEECFHEAVALNQNHLPSLLLSGIMAMAREKYEEAETYLEDTTCVDSRSVVAWTILGLFYELQDNVIRAEMAFLEANKQLQVAATALAAQQLEEDAKVDSIEKGERREKKHNSLVFWSSLDMGLDALKLEQIRVPKEGDGVLEGATDLSLSTALDLPEPLNNKHPTGKAVVGSHKSHTTITSKSKKTPHKVEQSDQRMSSLHEQKQLESVQQPTRSIFMETAHFLLHANALQAVERVLAHELLCQEKDPTSEYYVALAQVYLQQKNFPKAQEKLQKAVKIDHQNPDVWALTGHLYYLTQRYTDAKECYEHTVDLVKDASEMHPVYVRLGSIYIQEEEYEKAKHSYLVACKKSPTCLSWLGVGVACYRLGEVTEAEDALSEANILNNSNPEVWGYLTLVCLQKTGRQFEAEQSYKYAAKLNLKNQMLLREIEELQQMVGFGNPAF
uniref:Cilia and flagella associated protein 70 n=1 Tax=Latimeria chalumnae TaxID=7897 RepID=H3AYL6_LATCH